MAFASSGAGISWAAHVPTGQKRDKPQPAVAPSYDPPVVNEANPVSSVADHEYPNVPDNIGGQEAATAPGTGGRASIQQTDEAVDKVPFKDQVQGYAKKIAGTVFRNKDEKEFGQAKLDGQA